MDRQQRSLIIRGKLANGLLPATCLSRIWGNAGRGESCNGCEEPVTAYELLVEGIKVNGQAIKFHVECFYLWDQECRRQLLPGSKQPASYPAFS